MERRSWLAGLVLLAVLLAGCQKKVSRDPGRPEVYLQVFLDRSWSTEEKYLGGREQFNKDGMAITQAIVKPILTRHDNVRVDVSDFVRDQSLLFSCMEDKWERVASKLRRAINAPAYPTSEESKTLFSSLIYTLNQRARQVAPGTKIVVLVLTDGRPDEEYGAITAAAQAYSASGSCPMTLVIAPVQPDLQHRWRENLSDALAPLTGAGVTSYIVNSDDYNTAAKAVRVALGGAR